MQVSVSTLKDHRHEQTDFTGIHDSPSIRAVPEEEFFFFFFFFFLET